MPLVSRFFSSTPAVFVSAFVLRAVLLLYGIYHDAHSTVKYTDIDYYVFTDAARAVAAGGSPYNRDTYRYTPLLAWVLLPTAWSGKDGFWFHSGKALFAMSDLVAGWVILVLLQRQGMEKTRALKYASVWLLNPMVANISTRGSSEGLLCVMVVLTLWAFETRQLFLAGALLGLSVHFKIYPFIYGASMLWVLRAPEGSQLSSYASQIRSIFHTDRLIIIASSTFVFSGLNLLMYNAYGSAFLAHTFFYHLIRQDHRHNFSPYNTLLYFSSSQKPSSRGLTFEQLAFIPQLLLSTVLVPMALARTKNHLPTTLLVQTLAFVTFNKVCTSQYFLWYLIFLPLYLPYSSLISNPRKGLAVLMLWVLGQAFWLQQGFELEFRGKSTFVPGLWIAGLLFFTINCWILGIVITDVVQAQKSHSTALVKKNA